jgi:hypothetical protein
LAPFLGKSKAMLADQPVDLRAKTIPEKTHAGFSLAFWSKKWAKLPTNMRIPETLEI